MNGLNTQLQLPLPKATLTLGIGIGVLELSFVHSRLAPHAQRTA